MVLLSEEEQILFTNYYNLSQKDKDDICSRKRDRGMTVDEIARRYQITPPDVNRILHPPKNYGTWTAEEKLKHWIAGQRRSATVKRQNDEKRQLKLQKYGNKVFI